MSTEPGPGRNARALRVKAENARLEQAAAALRHSAAQDGLAGMRGEHVAYALAAVIDDVRMGLDPRTDALAAARWLLTGPDGRNDPRTGRGAARTPDGSAPDGS